MVEIRKERDVESKQAAKVIKDGNSRKFVAPINHCETQSAGAELPIYSSATRPKAQFPSLLVVEETMEDTRC